MENKTNKLIAAHYQLFAIDDKGERSLVEETSQEQPFVFITGFGAALDALEEKLEGLARGEVRLRAGQGGMLSASTWQSVCSILTRRCSP